MMQSNTIMFNSDMMEDEAAHVNQMMRKIKKARDLVFTAQ